MNSSTYRFVLDLHTAQSQISLPVLRGDTGRSFRISLSDGCNPYVIEDGCLAKLYIKRPTGTRIEEFCAIENNSTIVYNFSQNEYTCIVEGIHNCEVALYDLDGEKIASPRFTMVVSDRVENFDDITFTDEDYTVMDAMMAKEANRQAEETKRASAETKRLSAEAVRVSSEKARVVAETERNTAESDRKASESARKSAETVRANNEEVRVSKDKERDASISNAVNASSRAEGNSETALQKANSAYEDVANIKEEFGTESLIMREKTVKGSVNYAVSTANTAKEQSDLVRTNLINLSAQVQGIGRSYVVPDFLYFIDFLKSTKCVELKEDRNGDGVVETYKVYISDLKTGDNIIIVETGVPDFWFEKNSALSSFDTYTHNDTKYTLSATAGGATIGCAHILETDYTVIEGYSTSASASAKEAADSALEAKEAEANVEKISNELSYVDDGLILIDKVVDGVLDIQETLINGESNENVIDPDTFSFFSVGGTANGNEEANITINYDSNTEDTVGRSLSFSYTHNGSGSVIKPIGFVIESFEHPQLKFVVLESPTSDTPILINDRHDLSSYGEGDSFVVTGVPDEEGSYYQYFIDMFEVANRNLTENFVLMFEETTTKKLHKLAENELKVYLAGRGENLALIERNGERITKNEKRITNLEKGVMADAFETDDSVAYVKNVPADSLPYAAIGKIGGMTRKSANLIPFPYVNGSKTENGLTFTVNSDGGIAVSGTPTSYVVFVVSSRIDISNLDSFCLSLQGTYTNLAITGNILDKNDNKLAENISANVPYKKGDYPTASSVVLYVKRENNDVPCTGVAYPMLNEGETALPYEPYFEGLRSAPVTEVESVGENLLDLANIPLGLSINEKDGIAERTETGIKVTILKDMSDCWLRVLLFVGETNKMKGNTYTVSFGNYIPSFEGSNSKPCVGVVLAKTNNFYQGDASGLLGVTNTNSKELTFTIPADADDTTYPYIALTFYLAYGGAVYAGYHATYDDIIFNKGSTALPYTHYTKHTLPVPSEAQALDGYGQGISESLYNYIDYETKQFVKRVGAVDMGTLDWVRSVDSDYGIIRFYATVSGLKESEAIGAVAVLCAPYTTHRDALVPSRAKHKTMATYLNRVFIVDNTEFYADAAIFKSAMSGVMLYYELAEPIITDISNLISMDNLIEVEGGGTITMVNEHSLAVPSEIIYQLKGEST